jgi:hypothetical protein
MTIGTHKSGNGGIVIGGNGSGGITIVVGGVTVVVGGTVG